MLFEGFFGGWDEQGGGGTGREARRGPTRSKSERLERVAKLMQVGASACALHHGGRRWVSVAVTVDCGNALGALPHCSAAVLLR